MMSMNQITSMVFWTIGIVLLYNVTRAGLPDLQLK
jgi:hypothetical protein